MGRSKSVSKEVRLCEKVSWKRTDKYSLDHDVAIGFIEDDRLMSRIIGVGHEIDTPISLSIFFQGSLIIYECDDDLPIFRNIASLDEYEISIIDSLLIHRVSLCSQEEVFITRREELRRDGDLGLDILLGEDRHTACDSTDERDAPYLIAIGRIVG